MNLVNVSEKASDRKTTHANVSGERDMILLTNIAKCRKSERAYDVVVQKRMCFPFCFAWWCRCLYHTFLLFGILLLEMIAYYLPNQNNDGRLRVLFGEKEENVAATS